MNRKGGGERCPRILTRSLSARLNREGLRTAVIERKEVGGTCVNVGCTPTKALVASARAAHMARRGPDFGVLLDGPVRVDMKRVKARIKGIAGESNQVIFLLDT